MRWKEKMALLLQAVHVDVPDRMSCSKPYSFLAFQVTFLQLNHGRPMGKLSMVDSS